VHHTLELNIVLTVSQPEGLFVINYEITKLKVVYQSIYVQNSKLPTLTLTSYSL
jgi:hypothetical protein